MKDKTVQMPIDMFKEVFKLLARLPFQDTGNIIIGMNNTMVELEKMEKEPVVEVENLSGAV